jgi:hypothetical protein
LISASSVGNKVLFSCLYFGPLSAKYLPTERLVRLERDISTVHGDGSVREYRRDRSLCIDGGGE